MLLVVLLSSVRLFHFSGKDNHGFLFSVDIQLVIIFKE